LPLSLDPVHVHGIWYRHLPHRGRVWWRSDPPPSGRWQRGSVVAGMYLADSRDTAWAEWYRQLEELGLRPEHQLPRDLWRLEVDMDRVADLGDERRLAAVGLSLPRSVRREWPGFQTVGEQVYAEGWRGILAPSAARHEGRILCLFREEEAIEGVKPVPPPATYRRPPAPPMGA
jgi:RES domain-containing protein